VAAARLPANPVLGVPEAGVPCTDLPLDLVEGALGAPVELSSGLVRPDGAAVCSWAGLPGSVVFRAHQNRQDYAAARRTSRTEEGVQVAGLPPSTRGWSAVHRAGDLLVLVPPSTVVRLDVVPAAGWATEDLLTTPAEISLARAVIDSLT
jgi:hypothetical protein